MKKVIDKISEIKEGYTNLIKKDDEVMEAVSVLRMSICKQCDFYDKLLGSCKKCGCYMKAKTRVSSAKCPLGYWHEHTE